MKNLGNDYTYNLAQIIFRSGRYPIQHTKTKRLYDQINKGRYIETIDEESTIASIYLTMVRASESNIPPVIGLYNIVWYNNRPCVYGDVALAMVQSHKDFSDITIDFEGEPMTDDWRAYCTIGRKNSMNATNYHTATFCWSDAKRAGLVLLDHYQKYPERMLMIRARSWAIRDIFSDVLNGLSIAEEQRDIEIIENLQETDKKRIIRYCIDTNMDEFTKAALDAKGEVQMPNIVDALRPPDENSLATPSGTLTVEGLEKMKDLLSGDLK